MTKLLTQRHTSSESKAGQTVGVDSWLTVGRKRGGRWASADVFLDGAVMDAIRNPLCICNRGFITEVMQQNATWNYGPIPPK